MPTFRACPKCAQFEECEWTGSAWRCLRCGYTWPAAPAAADYSAFLAADYTVSWCCPTCGVHGRITEAQRDSLESILCTCGHYRPRLASRAPGYRREDADRRG